MFLVLPAYDKPNLSCRELLVVMMTVVSNFGAQQDAVLHYCLSPPRLQKSLYLPPLPQGFKL